MRNKKFLVCAIALVVIASAAAYWFKHKTPPKKPIVADTSLDAILADRKNHAAKDLETPLGKAIVSRNWQEVTQLYHPDVDFVHLGEIIRSLFIEQKIGAFTPADQDQLMTLALETIQNMPEKSYHLAGMLFGQFERLPSPKHGSLNFKTLSQWARNPKEASVKRRLGIAKLVLQDASPDPEIVKIYQKIVFGDNPLSLTHMDWIQRIDEIRNVSVQQAILALLEKNFKKVPDNAQAAALIILSHHVNPGQKEDFLRITTLKFLATEDLAKYEAALRALPPLIQGNWIKKEDKEWIVKRLTNTPSAVKTPFVTQKSQEILNLLGHS